MVTRFCRLQRIRRQVEDAPADHEPTSAISGKSVSLALVGRTACASTSAATVAISPPSKGFSRDKLRRAPRRLEVRNG
jgi:hypothetical protein